MDISTKTYQELSSKLTNLYKEVVIEDALNEYFVSYQGSEEDHEKVAKFIIEEIVGSDLIAEDGSYMNPLSVISNLISEYDDQNAEE